MKENDSKCGVCKISHFERNNYFYGKLITVRDFFAEQRYFNEKRWLINRMINGWGVVCGLDVRPNKGAADEVLVTPGLAIDCCGREILVCEQRQVELVPEESECHRQESVEQQGEKKFLICLEYFECKTEALHLPPIACDQKEQCEFNRIRDSFKIRVIPYQEQEPQQPPFCQQSREEKEKSLHQYLCDRLRDDAGCSECPDSHCVILAIVTVDPKGNLEIDPCSRRKLVYNNPMLYDLIHCFHGELPHVIAMNWDQNGKKLEWPDFESDIYEKGLTVTFDRQMDKATINENTFLLTVKIRDQETGNFKYEQVPGAVYYDEKTSIATFEIESAWLKDVYFGYSSVREEGGDFMVTLRGDFILSAEDEVNGRPLRALDGNFIGGDLPSGNGTQGGDFVSWFSVKPKSESASARTTRSRKRSR